MGYVSRSHDLPKKEKFDGLHKCLKNAFGRVFPKKEIPFQEIFDGLLKKESLMAYISNSKMLLAKITKKGNYMLENSEKCQKNLKKY